MTIDCVGSLRPLPFLLLLRRLFFPASAGAAAAATARLLAPFGICLRAFFVPTAEN